MSIKYSVCMRRILRGNIVSHCCHVVTASSKTSAIRLAEEMLPRWEAIEVVKVSEEE